MADLKSELSGSLAKLILGLMLTPAQYDAKQLRKAVEVTAGAMRAAPACPDRVVLHHPWQKRGRGDVGWMLQAFGTLWHWGWSSSSLGGTSGVMPRCPHAALAPHIPPPNPTSHPHIPPCSLAGGRHG